MGGSLQLPRPSPLPNPGPPGAPSTPTPTPSPTPPPTATPTPLPDPGLPTEPLVPIQSLREGILHPSDVEIMGDGTVLVSDLTYNHIARFNPEGDYLGAWPVPEGPVALAAHPNGNIYVALKREPTVGIFHVDPVTQTLVRSSPGSLGQGNGQVTYVQPVDLDIALDTGRIYVVDGKAQSIYGFNPDGTLQLRIMRIGSADGEFQYPAAIAVDETRSTLIVADQNNFRVQVLDLAGLFQRRFGARIRHFPNGPEAWMPRTQGIAVDSLGHIYLSDSLMSTVRLFENSGSEINKAVAYGYGVDEIRTPFGLALNHEGSRLYVVSTGRAEVKVFLTPIFPNHTVAFSTWVSTEASNESGIDFMSVAGGYVGAHFPAVPVICGRCHDNDGQPGGDVNSPLGQTMLCMSCHSGKGEGLQMPVSDQEIADPYGTNDSVPDRMGRTHAFNVPAVNPAADSLGPLPTSPMAPYLAYGTLIKCTTCHETHNHDAGTPYLRVSNAGDAMCKECHSPRNLAPMLGGTHGVGFDYPGGTAEYPPDADIAPLPLVNGRLECRTCHGVHGMSGDGMLLRLEGGQALCQTCHQDHHLHGVRGSWQPDCRTCHDVHDVENQNLSLIARLIENRTRQEVRPVVFTSRTGANSFDDGDPQANNGICQVCHTTTAVHLFDGTGAPHWNGIDCTICHTHHSGFMPQPTSDCTLCHTGD